MEARGFKSIGKTYSEIHVFTDTIIKRIIDHKDNEGYIQSNVVLSEKPAIYKRIKLYDERRRYFEQKQKSESCTM